MRGELVTGRAGCASGSDRPAGREYTDGSVTSCAAESSCAGLGEGTLRVGRLSRPRASRPHRAGAGFSRLSADLEGHPWVRASDHQGMVRGTWAGAAPRTWAIESRSQRFGEPLAPPDSVRHMSVTTATQRLTAAHHETQRHNSKKARETGKTQLTGRLRRWWQVLGSNQRRLSRRFYIRTPIPTHRNTHRPAHSPFLTASKPAFCPPRVRAYQVAQVSAPRVPGTRPRKSSGVPLRPDVWSPAQHAISFLLRSHVTFETLYRPPGPSA
jgi:hypothetical protein